MQNLLFDELCFKRLKKYFLIFAGACVVLISAIYTPIYLLLSSDALWQNSVVLFLWTELVKPLVDFSFYWGSFAFLIYILLRLGKKKIVFFALIYALTAVARYLFTMFVSFSMMAFPEWEMLWDVEVPGVIFSSVMDCLQMIGILLLTQFCCHRPLMLTKISSKGAGEEDLTSDCFPVEGLFQLKKPLPRLCFLSASIPAGLKLLSRLYYDIIVWGLPQDITDLLLVITYYIGDIAMWFIGYFVLLYVLQLFFIKETERRIQFEK